MVKCMITKTAGEDSVASGNDRFSVLLEGVSADQVGQMCYSMAERVESLCGSGSNGMQKLGKGLDEVFTAINNERMK